MDLERGKSVSVGPKTIKGCLTTTPNQTQMYALSIDLSSLSYIINVNRLIFYSAQQNIHRQHGIHQR